MSFPGSIAGAFPISCFVIMQCEPDAYADEALRKAQRTVPLAMIHGKTDPVVGYAMGQYSATLLVRRAGRHFVSLPTTPAATCSRDCRSARDPLAGGAGRPRSGDLARFRRNAAEATRIPRRHRCPAPSSLAEPRTSSQKRRADELGREIRAKASAGCRQVPALDSRGQGWNLDRWFPRLPRRVSSLRMTLTTPSPRSPNSGPSTSSQPRKALDEAHSDSSRANRTGYQNYQEIVQSYYASPLYSNVKKWLEERK